MLRDQIRAGAVMGKPGRGFGEAAGVMAAIEAALDPPQRVAYLSGHVPGHVWNWEASARESGVAATYREVKTDILRGITQGRWKPGSLLPNELDLAARYGCARATVNRAMRELAEEGLLERKRKAGTRVRMEPVRQARFDIPLVRREVEERGSVYRYALVRREAGPAPDWLRARLGLGAGVDLLHLVCMHYADGAPYQFEDRWINLGTLPQAREADFSETGPNEWLVAIVPFSSVEISLSATSADRMVADHLDCAPGDALFQAERSTWWEGRAVTYVRLVFCRGHRMTARY